MNKGIEEEAKKLGLDPMVVAFLDAGSLDERLDLLERLYPKITDDMIDIMAMAIDTTIPDDSDTDTRYYALVDSVRARLKYESGRLR